MVLVTRCSGFADDDVTRFGTGFYRQELVLEVMFLGEGDEPLAHFFLVLAGTRHLVDFGEYVKNFHCIVIYGFTEVVRL